MWPNSTILHDIQSSNLGIDIGLYANSNHKVVSANIFTFEMINYKIMLFDVICKLVTTFFLMNKCVLNSLVNF